MAALLLSHATRQTFHIFLDRQCRRRRRSRGWMQGEGRATDAGEREVPSLEWGGPKVRKVLRCVGTESAYSARRLQDSAGGLISDGMLSNF